MTVPRFYLYNKKEEQMMKPKSFEQQTIKDDFMFGAVMRDPKRCKPLLEHILGVKIKEIKYPELQKVIDNAMEAKSIRLDVYVEDADNTVYNIEIQTTDKKNLPKRMRYYQGMIDLNIISKGEDYKQLKKSYIIFICDYDEYGKGRHIYTFENICLEDTTIHFGDDTVKIVLNTKGTADDVSAELRDVLHYIGGEEPKGKLAKELDEGVEDVKKSEEWRREYMTLLMRDKENQVFGALVKEVSLIRKKLKRGKTASIIADELECDVVYIENIISLIEENSDWDDEDIASKLAEDE